MNSQLSTLYASMASLNESLTKRTYHIQCIGPSGDLVRCSGTLTFTSMRTQTLPENKSRNFILKRLLQYTEFLLCNGEELRKFKGRLVSDLSSMHL